MARVSRKLTIFVVLGVLAGVTLIGTSSTPAASTFGYTTVPAGPGCRLATVDLATADVTFLPAGADFDACVDDLAVAPDGTVYGITDIPDEGLSANLVTFDPTSGAVTNTQVFTGSFDGSFTAHGGLAFDRNGALYAQFTTNEVGCSDFAIDVFACLYRVDPATAAVTLIGNSGAGKEQVRMFWLTVSCAGTMLTGEQFTDIENGLEAPESPAPDPNASGDPDAAAQAPSTATPAPDLAAFGDDVGAQQLGLDLATVNSGTGGVTTGPQFAGGFSAFGLEFANPDGPLYALGVQAGGPVGLFIIDPATAGATLVNPTSEDELENLAIPGACPTVVEPTFTG